MSLRWCLFVAVCGLINGALILPAAAHDFGLIKADGAHFTYASDEDTNSDHNFFSQYVNDQNELEYEDRTDLNMVRKARWDWNDTTDGVWFATSAANLDDAAGDEVCRKKSGWAWNRKCDRARIRFLETADDLWWGTGEFISELVCHEFGHALGFEHRDSACMNDGLQGVSGTLNSHMINHVNDEY